MTTPLAAVGAVTARRPTRVRHVVLWLTVAAYMITYMDRVVMSAAVPSIQAEFGFDIVTMGWILSAFQLSYALFQIPGGWLGDKFGPRRVLTGIVTWWSAFTALTTATWSASSMIACRFLFGMGEAGAFPNATRSLSRWMLPSERGWAQGITHAGARLGAAVTPALAVLLITSYGWRAPFIAFALLGLIWAAIWFWYYRDDPSEHASVNDAERELIEGSLGRVKVSAGAAVPWRRILTSPQMWVLSAMYFCYGYDITVFLSWFPKYLNDARGLSLTQMGIYASLPLMAGVAGDIAGGWFSDRLVERSGKINWGRRAVAVTGFLIAAAAMPFAVLAETPLASIAYFGAAVFALELTVGVSWAVPLDIGGQFAGSVSAVMNTCGNIGGTIAAALTGYIVAQSGWTPAFLLMAVLAVIAALLFTRIDASRRIDVDRSPADLV
ncbi:MAG: MFS transporter [Rhodospirillaceae bacterium]|nr:MFS transporter [Rhodospirillaceae bacterium]